VEGRLKLDTWEDKNTKQKQSKLKVVLESFSFLDSNRADAGNPAPGPPRTATTAPVATAEPAETEPPPPEDDVPF
jgi:single-strand DNA-binding protein